MAAGADPRLEDGRLRSQRPGEALLFLNTETSAEEDPGLCSKTSALAHPTVLLPAQSNLGFDLDTGIWSFFCRQEEVEKSLTVIRKMQKTDSLRSHC